MRYERHREMFSDDAWARLCSLRIVVAGVGGLGSHVLDTIVRLAPLHLEIWDPARIDEPDLNRQTLYSSDDLGKSKANVAAARLSTINPDGVIFALAREITGASTLGESFSGAFDVCFDCLDSFLARAALEEAFVRSAGQTGVAVPDTDRPILVHGGVGGFFGQAALLRPPMIGYADLFGPDFSAIATTDKKIMPATVAAVAAIQASEFAAWVLGERSFAAATTQLVTYDGTSSETSRLTVRRTG